VAPHPDRASGRCRISAGPVRRGRHRPGRLSGRGSAIYAAAGIGIIHQDGDFADDPFFAFKAGLDLEVLPSLYLDISACYRFNSKYDFDDAMDEIDTDTVFLGAAVRLGF